MYKINRITNFNIFFNIAFIIILVSNLLTIIYNLAAKILDITNLHFIKDKYIILALLIIPLKCYIANL